MNMKILNLDMRVSWGAVMLKLVDMDCDQYLQASTFVGMLIKLWLRDFPLLGLYKDMVRTWYGHPVTHDTQVLDSLSSSLSLLTLKLFLQVDKIKLLHWSSILAPCSTVFHTEKNFTNSIVTWALYEYPALVYWNVFLPIKGAVQTSLLAKIAVNYRL